MQEELFGQRLRAERERRRITLESIAANTKISIGLLRDLENDRVAHWPGGIFRRSFLKSYATAIGLDPDDTLQEFLARYPDHTSAGRHDGADRLQETGAEGKRAPFGPHRRAGLRLTMADEPRVFSAGAVLKTFKVRLLAVALDIAVPAAVGGASWWVVGSFWAPFAVALMCYLVVGVLVLGNTPGIFMQAARAGARPRPAPPVPGGDEAGHLAIFEESLIR
jgi:transcriptional regulator with XRE-family HTH domain